MGSFIDFTAETLTHEIRPESFILTDLNGLAFCLGSRGFCWGIFGSGDWDCSGGYSLSLGERVSPVSFMHINKLFNFRINFITLWNWREYWILENSERDVILAVNFR